MAAQPQPIPTARAPAFPETQTTILVRAAGGDWEPFFKEYLAPCWREVMLACRGRLPMGDAPDLLQELTVRLLRDGRGRPVPGSPAEPPRGNIPQRYLARKRLGVASASFRTYLKQVIGNLIEEHARKAKRQVKAQSLSARVDPSIEDSISSTVDRHWVAACLVDAARQFRAECGSARTRGHQRHFELLYLATVKGLSPAAVARQLGLHRTTVSVDLAAARDRFVAMLSELSGIADREVLKSHVAADPSRLFEALEDAHRSAEIG